MEEEHERRSYRCDMSGKLLFEIAVYRTSLDDHLKELESEKRAYMKRMEDGYSEYERSGADPEIRSKYLKRMEYAFYDRRLTWFYNQVIGWIRLNGYWDVIKGDFFFAREKRLVREPKTRSFEWRGKALEVWLPHDATSKEIYELLLSELNELRRERPFKGRFMDLEAFENIGPHIDWKNAVV